MYIVCKTSSGLLFVKPPKHVLPRRMRYRSGRSFIALATHIPEMDPSANIHLRSCPLDIPHDQDRTTGRVVLQENQVHQDARS